MMNSIKFKQQVNIIENDVLELQKMLEKSGVYKTNKNLYNAINDMIVSITSQTNSIRKTVKNFSDKKILKG